MESIYEREERADAPKEVRITECPLSGHSRWWFGIGDEVCELVRPTAYRSPPMGLTDVVPFLVEDMLKSVGGHYEQAADWSSFVLTDGKLVTGQNPASSAEAARQILALLA